MKRSRSWVDKKDYDMDKAIIQAHLKKHPFRIRSLLGWDYLAKTREGLVWVPDSIGQDTLKFTSEESALNYMEHNLIAVDDPKLAGVPIRGTIVRFQ